MTRFKDYKESLGRFQDFEGHAGARFSKNVGKMVNMCVLNQSSLS